MKCLSFLALSGIASIAASSPLSIWPQSPATTIPQSDSVLAYATPSSHEPPLLRDDTTAYDSSTAYETPLPWGYTTAYGVATTSGASNRLYDTTVVLIIPDETTTYDESTAYPTATTYETATTYVTGTVDVTEIVDVTRTVDATATVSVTATVLATVTTSVTQSLPLPTGSQFTTVIPLILTTGSQVLTGEIQPSTMKYPNSTIGSQLSTFATQTLTMTSEGPTVTFPTVASYTTVSPYATVTAGLSNGSVLSFSPPYISYVPAGSTIRFEFHAKNHTLTESSKEHPCRKLDSSSIDTGFDDVNLLDQAPFSTYDLRIENEETRIFHCQQSSTESHCHEGMVFGVNIGKFDFWNVLLDAVYKSDE